jgi:hypothetical protein
VRTSLAPMNPPSAIIRAEPNHQNLRPPLQPSHDVGQDVNPLMPSCEVQLGIKRIKGEATSMKPTAATGLGGPGLLPWREDFGVYREVGERLGRGRI